MPLWLALSLCSVPLFGTIWLAPKFYHRNFGVSTETFLVWYTLGLAVGLGFFLRFYTTKKLWYSAPVTFSMLLVGLVLGALANGLVFATMPYAPSPGLPISVSSGGTIITLLASWLLAKILPTLFDTPTIAANQILGTGFIVMGLILFAWKK